MAVKLREKMLSNGQVSFYLDIYHNKRRWYEFLNVHINKKKPSEEDKEKRRLASEIRTKREHELIVEDNGLVDKKRKHADFMTFFKTHIQAKPHNYQRTATLYQLNEFAKGRPILISSVTTNWMKDFERFLLKSVSNNTALSYLKNINGALNELVRKQIIPRNPWHGVPKHERLKKKDVMRTAWSIEQLQKLSDTPCNIETQFKQAYFFACFTGLRWNDVNGLMWSNIISKTIRDSEQWFIYFEQQKVERIEYFPLSDQAIDILKAQVESRNGECVYVFPLVKETDPKTGRVHGNVNYA